MKKSILLLCLALACYLGGVQAQAQNYQLTGIVLDSTSQEGLPGATVMLVSPRDTNDKRITVTNVEGQFSFSNLPHRFYMMTIRYVGYETGMQRVRLEQAVTRLGDIKLRSRTLDEIEIKGDVIMTEVKGDTLQYNADAFKTNPDATAEDLVRKMPGVTVEGGQVQAQGEQVRRVLIDGREFFGEDAAAALRNLPANMISAVQVLDQQSDQARFSGFDDGNTTKALNIVTKPEYRNGTFGRAYAGYGTDNRYQAGGNLNNFSDARRLSVIGLSNNINQQNFGAEDLAGVAGAQSGAGRGRRGGGGPGGFNFGNQGEDFSVGQQNGINTTNALGLNYTNEWNKKLKLTGSYFYNQTRNVNDQRLFRTFFLEGNESQLYSQNSIESSNNENHRLQLRLEYALSEKTNLIWTPRATLQLFSAQSRIDAFNTTPQDVLLNQSVNTYRQNNEAWRLNNDLLLRHAFAKRGRTITLNLTTGYNNSQEQGALLSENQFFERPSLVADSLNQQNQRLNTGFSWNTSLTYTEPMGKQGQLQFNYRIGNTFSAADRETFNFDPVVGRFNLLDTALSNQLRNDYFVQQIGAGYRFNSQKGIVRGGFGVNWQYATLSVDERFPNAFALEKDFINWLPYANLALNFNKQSNLRLFYRTNTQAPSASQLQGVVDNTNPLLLRAGNPDLNQAFSHNIFTRFRYANPNGHSFFALLGGSFTQDFIGNNTTIAVQDVFLPERGITLNQGTQLTSFENLDGFYSLRSFVTYGLPLNKLKVNLNFNVGGSYSRTPSIINGIQNQSESYNLSQGLTLSSNISEKIDYTLSYTFGYNDVRNAIQPALNNTFFTQTANLKTNVIFWKGFVWQQDLAALDFQGLAEGFNQQFLLWNMGIGKKFLAGQAGELRLTVFDLLGQNNSIARNVTDVFIEDVQNQVLTRYYMLTFTYNLRKFKE
ncbi:outer membrane beta-barrel protein [Eisenibacter elegans]|uniref:outer membrane beta-barrel protein n=1 Tax=Eisenibacter elegans TaxID=997 RepID=UPI0005537BDB|nr:outer membrane beta-barrel protein [Eisenibacter elegans]